MSNNEQNQKNINELQLLNDELKEKNKVYQHNNENYQIKIEALSSSIEK